GIDELAFKLIDRTRIGLSDELAEKLNVLPGDTVRGRLLATTEGNDGPLGIYLLSAYVIDDTDFWSDGEIYWWSIPVMKRRDGTVSWSTMTGLPAGAKPHDVGSQEWMTNFSLADPPLIAVVPNDDDITECVIRIAFYDDDGALADVPKAMGEGYRALSSCEPSGLTGPQQIIAPVRDAIFRSLRAEQDDILIDEDVTIRRGEMARFGAGFVGAVINSMIRIYYLVNDEMRTVRSGPFALRKGQMETVCFDGKFERGGRLSVFARGADVSTSAFGDLTTDVPYVNRVLDERSAITLSNGFTATAKGPAKLVAYYTPPPHIG
ncbi:MAG: hypothetical protein MUF54_16365, partial [Polyangiaceae bacterium]|nr:hypothetical protein [Polyangiaceae bacterium]